MGNKEEPREIGAIHLIGIGPIPRALLEELTVHLSRRISLPCRLLASPLEDPPRLPDREEQVDADALLKRLEGKFGEDGIIRVGVTFLDLAIPIFTFVFGRARIQGRVALVSLARLRPEFYGLPPDPPLTLRRAGDEILHEMGHVAGLHHCRDYRCLMHFAASIEKVDLRNASFCEICAAELPPALRTRSLRTD